MSPDTVHRCLGTWRTSASWLVDPVGVDVVFGDVLSVGGEDADVAAVGFRHLRPARTELRLGQVLLGAPAAP
jgi:hypothetical protein